MELWISQRGREAHQIFNTQQTYQLLTAECRLDHLPESEHIFTDTDKLREHITGIAQRQHMNVKLDRTEVQSVPKNRDNTQISRFNLQTEDMLCNKLLIN